MYKLTSGCGLKVCSVVYVCMYVGVEAAEFVCGRAEDVLQRYLEESGEEGEGEVIGVVDPPRAGLRTFCECVFMCVCVCVCVCP